MDAKIWHRYRQQARKSLRRLAREAGKDIRAVKSVLRPFLPAVLAYTALVRFPALGFGLRTLLYLAVGQSLLRAFLLHHPSLNNLRRIGKEEYLADLVFKSPQDYYRFKEDLDQFSPRILLELMVREELAEEEFVHVK